MWYIGCIKWISHNCSEPFKYLFVKLFFWTISRLTTQKYIITKKTWFERVTSQSWRWRKMASRFLLPRDVTQERWQTSEAVCWVSAALWTTSGEIPFETYCILISQAQFTSGLETQPDIGKINNSIRDIDVFFRCSFKVSPCFTWILDSINLILNIIELKLEIQTSKVTGNPHTGTAAKAANPGDLRAKVFGKPLAQIPKAKASSSRAFYQDGPG